MPTEKEDFLTIKGTTGVAISNALYMYSFENALTNRYMKYYCNSTITWGEHNTGDHIEIPTPLPRINKEWTEEVLFMYSYYHRSWLSIVTT